ncbi:helix-turn-helix domain-containing protein [Flavobacterium caeni]|nr:helix-turn-helix domain-containing protein [Flavobacterium caeni]
MENWAMFADFILIAGMAFLAMSVLLLVKSKPTVTRRLLIVFFASAFFFLLYYYSFLHRSRVLGAIAVLFGHGMGFILGPMLYFLLQSLVLPPALFLKRLYLHLIPYALVWLLVSLPLALSIATPYCRDFGDWYANHDYWINLPENVFFLTYIYFSLRLHTRIAGLVRENSAAERHDLSWYRHLLWGLALIVVFDTLCTFYEFYFPMIPWNIGTLIAFSFVALFSYLGYKGMFQSHILLPDFLLNRLEKNEPTGFETTPTSTPKTPLRALDGYSESEIEAFKTKLLHVMETQKPYLNEALGLGELADSLGIGTKKLSDLLNQHLHTNFYNFVNEYRVREVVERLATPDAEKYTLMGIAYDCGFQSKASFNRIFKQKMGMSPSEYKKNIPAF